MGFVRTMQGTVRGAGRGSNPPASIHLRQGFGGSVPQSLTLLGWGDRAEVWCKVVPAVALCGGGPLINGQGDNAKRLLDSKH